MAGAARHLTIDVVEHALDSVPIVIDGVSGDFAFTQDSIELKDITGRVEEAPLKIHGRVDNYAQGADAGFDMTVESGEGDIRIPKNPRWTGALPRPIRKIYDWFKPEGVAALTFHAAKDKPTKYDPDPDLRYAGKVQIIRGDFQFIKFPYPAHNASGTIEFAQDVKKGIDAADMSVQAYGAPGGPNANTTFTLKGHMAPLNSQVKVDIVLDGANVSSEPVLAAAYPPNVRKAIEFFDADGKGLFPKYHGKFHANVMRPYGEDTDWTVNIDLDIDDAAGKMVAFPYLLEHVAGSAHIRKGYVEIPDFHMTRGQSSLNVDGRVSWEDKDDDDVEHYDHNKVTKVALTQDIHVIARGVPVDEALKKALPGGKRAWLDKLGLSGVVDVDGKVFTPKDVKPGDDEDVTYDLKLALRDGVIHPPGGDFVIDQVSGDLRMSPTGMAIERVNGKRLGANVNAHGKFEWPGDQPRADLHIEAAGLPLDKALYRTVPKAVQESWDEVKPIGTTDMSLDLRLGYDTVVSAKAKHAPEMHLVLRPRQLSMTPVVLPYRLDNLQGTIDVTDENIMIPALAATHGKAGIKLAGRGTLSDRKWDLAINAADVQIDDEFRNAVPKNVSQFVHSMEMGGTFDLLCPHIAYRAGKAKEPDEDPDVDYSAKFILKNASMTAGVPLVEMNGQAELTGTIRRAGTVSEINGTVDIASLKIAGRSAKDFHLELSKSPGSTELRIDRMQSILAGGEMAGQLMMTFPDKGPSKYTLALVLRNADIREMAGKFEEKISGQMNASLSLEGNWDNDAARAAGMCRCRGRTWCRFRYCLDCSK